MNQKIIISFSFILLLLGFQACNSETKPKELNKEDTVVENNAVKEKNPLSILISNAADITKIGDVAEISVALEKGSKTDSVSLLINDKLVKSLTDGSMSYQFDTKLAKAGQNIITAQFVRNGNTHRVTKSITLKSDIIPKQFGYKVVNTYKHDVEAYTQGLFFLDGFLYEATGLKGQSTVRKVKTETGEVIQGYAIPKEVFGEGICLSNGKIIQLSWQAGRGFVYNKDDFSIETEFSYGTEGWGLTTDGETLFMTDGTSTMYLLEPETYTLTGQLEVYDNEGPVKNLNELEFIDGVIYANVYMTDNIVKIDPKTGKVLAYINLSKLLPMNDYVSGTDVLNGIAYDKENKRLFVTGKNWPKLFEIKLIEK